MRKAIKILTRAGRDSDVWPVALLLIAVVVPALCLLWFMNAAVRNERLATRQKAADLFRSQLLSVQAQVAEYWNDLGAQLDELARTNPPPVAFAKAIEAGLADSLIVFNAEGRLAYPNLASAIPNVVEDRRWADAGQFEHRQKDFAKAAALYHALGKETTNAGAAARAFQAEARCLVHAGRKDAAIRLVIETFGDPRYRHAADPQGRSIAANVDLMAYELSRDETIARRLQQRLMDYENPALAAPQRRFLMKELRTLLPGMEFPTLLAEESAAQVPPSVRNATADRIPGTDLWHRTSPDRRAVALFREATLAKRLEHVLGSEVKLIPPGLERPDFLLSVAAPGLPGWQMAVTLQHAPKPPVAVYLWTGVLVLAGVGVLTLLAVRVVRRQVALARLKNDLVATVSHELKTPLSSMKLLVDTLLNAENSNQQTTREYLQLIARENDRLSRLVENFLTFSRIERKKHVFEFKRTPVRPIIDAAVKAVPAGHFDLHVKPGLPEIMGDPDALATALINLIENAGKHSENGHPITMRAHANNGSVVVSVQDSGPGIESRELKKIFEPFYQVDQSLSRKAGGCGLGLSIVQSIVEAHHGRVTVESQPGRGSTFSISLPAA
jgi:signal transduction histidine kinase